MRSRPTSSAYTLTNDSSEDPSAGPLHTTTFTDASNARERAASFNFIPSVYSWLFSVYTGTRSGRPLLTNWSGGQADVIATLIREKKAWIAIVVSAYASMNLDSAGVNYGSISAVTKACSGAPRDGSHIERPG